MSSSGASPGQSDLGGCAFHAGAELRGRDATELRTGLSCPICSVTDALSPRRPAQSALSPSGGRLATHRTADAILPARFCGQEGKSSGSEGAKPRPGRHVRAPGSPGSRERWRDGARPHPRALAELRPLPSVVQVLSFMTHVTILGNRAAGRLSTGEPGHPCGPGPRGLMSSQGG